jgi:hypothetical protein
VRFEPAKNNPAAASAYGTNVSNRDMGLLWKTLHVRITVIR